MHIDSRSSERPPTGGLNPRQRRLQADQDELLRTFAGHPYIAVQPLGAQPCEQYRIVYSVPGLVTDSANQLQVWNQHLVNITLPAGYPREKPYCTCDSPVFHPNFGNYICIADFWSPSQSLIDVVIQIGDMLQYKLYNIRSPLNAVAARWVAQNPSSVPLADLNLRPALPEVHLLREGGSQ